MNELVKDILHFSSSIFLTLLSVMFAFRHFLKQKRIDILVSNTNHALDVLDSDDLRMALKELITCAQTAQNSEALHTTWHKLNNLRIALLRLQGQEGVAQKITLLDTIIAKLESGQKTPAQTAAEALALLDPAWQSEHKFDLLEIERIRQVLIAILTLH